MRADRGASSTILASCSFAVARRKTVRRPSTSQAERPRCRPRMSITFSISATPTGSRVIPGGHLYWLREAVRRNPADGDAHFVLAAALIRAAPPKPLASGSWPSVSPRHYEEWDGGRRRKPSRPGAGEERRRAAADTRRRSLAQPASGISGSWRVSTSIAAAHVRDGARSKRAHELNRALFSVALRGRAHLSSGGFTCAAAASEAIDALKISLWSEETARGARALGEAYLEAKDLAAPARKPSVPLRWIRETRRRDSRARK